MGCVDVSESTIAENSSYVRVEKEIVRVSDEALKKLKREDVMMIVPKIYGNKTSLVLKKPKTASSIRQIWLPRTVARLLLDYKECQERYIADNKDFYTDYNFVISQEGGRPLSEKVLNSKLQRLIAAHGLLEVSFHSTRHTSITYKLRINQGDIKAVQGDSGHAAAKMVTDRYSHIIDEDRRNNTISFEREFYSSSSKTDDISKPVQQMLALFSQNPELLNQLSSMLNTQVGE